MIIIDTDGQAGRREVRIAVASSTLGEMVEVVIYSGLELRQGNLVAPHWNRACNCPSKRRGEGRLPSNGNRRLEIDFLRDEPLNLYPDSWLTSSNTVVSVGIGRSFGAGCHTNDGLPSPGISARAV